MTRIFPSIAHGATICYEAHKSTMDLFNQTCRRDHRYVSDWISQYQTYGHGTAQHSPNDLVPKQNFGDCLASLAQAALDDAELQEIIGRNWPDDRNADTVRFLRTVKYQEGKPRWYCTSERKTSSATSKRHDRRWTEVPEWANGTPEAVYRLQDFGTMALLESFARYEHTRDIVNEGGAWTGSPGWSYLDLDRDAPNAFNAAASIACAYRARQQAKSQLSCYINNTRRHEEIESKRDEMTAHAARLNAEEAERDRQQAEAEAQAIADQEPAALSA